MSKAIIDLGYFILTDPPQQYIDHINERIKNPRTHGPTEKKEVGWNAYKYTCRTCGISWSRHEDKK